MVVFNDIMVSDDVLADTSVSVHEEVPVLALWILTDEGCRWFLRLWIRMFDALRTS